MPSVCHRRAQIAVRALEGSIEHQVSRGVFGRRVEALRPFLTPNGLRPPAYVATRDGVDLEIHLWQSRNSAEFDRIRPNSPEALLSMLLRPKRNPRRQAEH